MTDLLPGFGASGSGLLAAAGGLLVIIVAGAAGWRIRARRRRDINRRLREACHGLLADFVIPDGTGGQIQVQYALLTGRGIIVLDIKDVAGHVFGSEAMQDWTVIANDHRYTFVNPQPGLWDRVAAVKRLVSEAPVTGVVAFTDRARFSKGQPRAVVMLESLLQDLAQDRAATRELAGAGLEAGWERLQQAAIAARMERLLSDQRE